MVPGWFLASFYYSLARVVAHCICADVVMYAYDDHGDSLGSFEGFDLIRLITMRAHLLGFDYIDC